MKGTFTTVALAFICAAAGCSSALDGNDRDGSRPVDALPCACEVDAGVMTMTWNCYCEKFGCDWSLPPPQRPMCESLVRVDYPECGLTRHTGTGFGVFEHVFDSSGRLVGATVVSDTSPYACPSDPQIQANTVRSGRRPEPSCSAAECDGCYTGSFPCSWGDGGTRD